MLVQQRLEFEGEHLERVVPIDRVEALRLLISQQRSGRAVGCGERRECFPTFGTCQTQVYRILRIWRKTYGVAILQMRLKTATYRTEAAHQ